jgi:hypothetical protein
MRLADAVLRQGHLSDRALTEAILTGERPAHIDRCDLCADRALELGRWLDAVRDSAFESADAVFTPEKLAAQQTQIQRKLEQLDEPRRVIAFPGQTRHTQPETGRRRVAPAWLGVAAAAGLVVGAIGGQAAARFDRVPTAKAQPTAAVPVSTPAQPDAPTFAAATASLLEMDMDSMVVPAQLGAINDITPKIQTISMRR